MGFLTKEIKEFLAWQRILEGFFWAMPLVFVGFSSRPQKYFDCPSIVLTVPVEGCVAPGLDWETPWHKISSIHFLLVIPLSKSHLLSQIRDAYLILKSRWNKFKLHMCLGKKVSATCPKDIWSCIYLIRAMRVEEQRSKLIFHQNLYFLSWCGANFDVLQLRGHRLGVH